MKRTKFVVHKEARNHRAWGLGKWRGSKFEVRRVVWGRLLAREERRADEVIVRLILWTETPLKVP